MNVDIKRKTIKLTIDGAGYLYRRQIKQAFMTSYALTDDDFLYVHKQDKSREWYVTMQTTTMADRILRDTEITIDQVKCIMEQVSKQKLHLKVHWLPVWVTNGLLVEYFRQFGEVVSVANVWSHDANVNTEMRDVTLIVDDEGKHRIPHVVRFDGGIKILITCPGRLPIA